MWFHDGSGPIRDVDTAPARKNPFTPRAPSGWELPGPGTTLTCVQRVLLATDSDELFAEIDSAIGSNDVAVVRVRAGVDVRPAIQEVQPDIVLLDLQIGSMGAYAVTYDLRNEEGAGRIDPQNIVLLLDRDVDTFLAERSGADGWLVKPLTPRRIQRGVDTVLRGEVFEEGSALFEV